MDRQPVTAATHDAAVHDPRLRWYPTPWRVRYGDELLALLDSEYGDGLPGRVRIGLMTGGLRERARQSGLSGETAPAPDRIRAGVLVVLSAWTAFVIAGASFAKFSEHFDEALPHAATSHRVPDVAFAIVQELAGVTAILVLLGIVLAAPAVARFLRSGGWSSVRRHVYRALACTVVAAGVSVPLVIWSHHLASQQRTLGFHWYGALFLVWAVLVATTLALWTSAAVATTRRLPLHNEVLRIEAALAVGIAGMMAAMVGATALWWGAMAKSAPSFLTGSPGGVPASPWDAWLVGTVLLMLVAVAAAGAGAQHVIRTLVLQHRQVNRTAA